MDLEFIILSAILGLVSSVAGGFWGLGCGWLVVPGLLLLPGEISQPVAAGACMMQLLPSTFLTVRKQFRTIGWKKNSWGLKAALPLCGFSFVGGFFGRHAGDGIEALTGGRIAHQYLYVALLFYILWKTIGSNKNQREADATPGDIKFRPVAIIGLFEGVVASLLGIGGGTLNRPVMRNVLRIPEESTAKIGRLGVFVTALSGTIGYSINNPQLGQMTSIAGAIAVGGIIGFPVGAAVHAKLINAGKGHLAEKSFALVVGLVLASIIFKLAGFESIGRLIMAGSGLFLIILIGYAWYISTLKIKVQQTPRVWSQKSFAKALRSLL